VIGAVQLRDCGVSKSTVCRWNAEGKLHRLHRGVYAMGHRSVPIEGRMVAGLIAVGPDAVLSHATAAWWWGLIDTEPVRIELTNPRRAKDRDDFRVYRASELERTRHRGFPVTTVPRTVLDLAARDSVNQVRRALAEAEYRRMLDVDEVKRVLARGLKGSRTLRAALRAHEPRLARTRSGVERRFLELCERAALPLPDVNVKVGRMTVDALWRDARLAVELDTYNTHGSPARMERDRRRELHLRAAGFTVVRYTDQQIDEQPQLIAADLRLSLAAPSG
jgi:very-short-patch-repair endonuclease